MVSYWTYRTYCPQGRRSRSYGLFRKPHVKSSGRVMTQAGRLLPARSRSLCATVAAICSPAEELPLSSWPEEISAPQALTIRHRRTRLQSEGELRRSAFLLRSECRKRYAQKAHTFLGGREWRKQVQAHPLQHD